MTVKIKKPTHKALKIMAITLETEVGALADELIKCGIAQMQHATEKERRKPICEAIKSAQQIGAKTGENEADDAI